jgi:hypothetical protein
MLSSLGSLNQDTQTVEKWDLKRTETFRQDMATTAGSGVESSHDLHTTRGLGLATLVGGVHLLLAPFPWQLRGGSLRMVLTTPEMVVWWYFFFVGVLPGVKYAIRHRFGDVMPLLLFILLLGVIYSLTFGNVGTAYRQRAQLMPYLLTFAALGLERRKLRRDPISRTHHIPMGWGPDDLTGSSPRLGHPADVRRS